MAEITFTEREEQILGLLARFCTYKEIGISLSLKVSTVEQHIYNIRRKTGKIGIKLVEYAIEHGYGKKELVPA